MKKASPIDLRKALEAVESFKACGILFVPIPCLDTEDHDRLVESSLIRLEKLGNLIERKKPTTEGKKNENK